MDEKEKVSPFAHYTQCVDITKTNYRIRGGGELLLCKSNGESNDYGGL